jgi:hypothetical protein
MTEEMLLKLRINAKCVRVGERISMYEAGPIVVDAIDYYFGFNFYDHQLWRIQIRIENGDGILSDRSKEKEIQKKREHDIWLAKELPGKQEYRYTWGKAESIYDDEYTQSSYILITYNNEP